MTAPLAFPTSLRWLGRPPLVREQALAGHVTAVLFWRLGCDACEEAARELARRYPVERPAVYLVRDTRNRPAFDAEAFGRGNSRTRPELADTVWMTAATRHAGTAMAHELAHVLMDSGEHSDAPGNLMRDETAEGNTVLSEAQCARLRDTGSRNGLLAR